MTSARGNRCNQVLATAIAAHRAGQFESARLGYTAVLEQEPQNFDALNLLGVVAVQLGQPGVGESLLKLALSVNPRSHEALGNLAMALRSQGRDEDAESALRAALDLAPRYIDALRNLATLCQSQGNTAEAVALLSRAVASAPDQAVLRGNLGALLLSLGDAEEAWQHLVHASRLAPNDPHVLANLGRAGLETDRIDRGLEAVERATRLMPNHVPALVTLSALERVRGQFDAAERHAQAALQAASGDRGAQLNLATSLIEMARYDEGAKILDGMLAADPYDAEAHCSRAAASFAHGQLESAWPHHGWRWRLPNQPIPHPPALPEWQGEALGDGTLYVWPEQGIGEQLVFASAIAELTQRAASVVVACDARLVGMFARSFAPVRVVAVDELNGIAAHAEASDRQCSLVDLGALLRPTLAAFPPHRGYLVPDAAAVAHWRGWLASLGEGLKIGISWRSQNQRGERRLACMQLAQWAPLFAVPGVQFVCLQYDECSREVAATQARFSVPIHMPPALDQHDDLDGVVALMQRLDLVISAPTAVSILAGAVGVPTWQLTRGVDWQGMGYEQSPWLPAIRPVHRRWDRSWDDVLADVAQALQRFLAARSGPAV